WATVRRCQGKSSAPRRSPGSRTRSRATPTTGARSSARRSSRSCLPSRRASRARCARASARGRKRDPRSDESRQVFRRGRGGPGGGVGGGGGGGALRREGGSVILEATNLAKSFGGVEAVRGASFGVVAGEVVAMIGPNGAGKTTCFNLVNGQLAADAGSVRLDGRDITGLAS